MAAICAASPAAAQPVRSTPKSLILQWPGGSASQDGYDNASTFVEYHFAPCVGTSVQVMTRLLDPEFEPPPLYWYRGKRYEVPPFLPYSTRVVTPGQVRFSAQVIVPSGPSERQLTAFEPSSTLCDGWQNTGAQQADLWSAKATPQEKIDAMMRLEVDNGRALEPLRNEAVERYLGEALAQATREEAEKAKAAEQVARDRAAQATPAAAPRSAAASAPSSAPAREAAAPSPATSSSPASTSSSGAARSTEADRVAAAAAEARRAEAARQAELVERLERQREAQRLADERRAEYVEEAVSIVGNILEERRQDRERKAREEEARWARAQELAASAPACDLGGIEPLNNSFGRHEIRRAGCRVGATLPGKPFAFELSGPESILFRAGSFELPLELSVHTASGQTLGSVHSVADEDGHNQAELRLALNAGSFVVMVAAQRTGQSGKFGVTAWGDPRYSTVDGKRVATDRPIVPCIERMAVRDTLRPGESRSGTTTTECGVAYGSGKHWLRVDSKQSVEIRVAADEASAAGGYMKLYTARGDLGNPIEDNIRRDFPLRLKKTLEPGLYSIWFVLDPKQQSNTFAPPGLAYTVSVSGRGGAAGAGAPPSQPSPFDGVTGQLRFRRSAAEPASTAPTRPTSFPRLKPADGVSVDVSIGLAGSSASGTLPVICTLTRAADGMHQFSALASTTVAPGTTSSAVTTGELYSPEWAGGWYRVHCGLDVIVNERHAENSNEISARVDRTHVFAVDSFHVEGGKVADNVTSSEQDQRINAAAEAWERSDFATAGAIWGQLIAEGVRSGAMYHNLATALLKQDSLASALEALAMAGEYADVDARTLAFSSSEVAVAAFNAQRYDIAEEGFRRVAESTDLPEAWYNLSSSLYKQQKWPDLVPAAARAVELKPTDPNLLLMLAHAYKNTGENAKAVEILARYEALPK